MEKDTYYALKNVLEVAKRTIKEEDFEDPRQIGEDLARLDEWIEEVAKNYDEPGEGDFCPTCGDILREGHKCAN